MRLLIVTILTLGLAATAALAQTTTPDRQDSAARYQAVVSVETPAGSVAVATSTPEEETLAFCPGRRGRLLINPCLKDDKGMMEYGCGSVNDAGINADLLGR